MPHMVLDGIVTKCESLDSLRLTRFMCSAQPLSWVHSRHHHVVGFELPSISAKKVRDFREIKFLLITTLKSVTESRVLGTIDVEVDLTREVRSE